MKTVNKEMLIEELIERVPASISYLSDKGIRCIRCGEPIWGTLEEAAREKGFSDSQIDEIVQDLNNLSS